MTSAALPRHALMPRQPPGLRLGLALAVLAHGLLVIALAVGVNWRSREPQGVEAELWSAVPQAAAPAAAPAAVVPPVPVPMPTPNVRSEPPAPVVRPPVPEPRRPEPVVRPQPTPQAVPDPQIAIDRAKRETARREEEERNRVARRDQAARDQAKLVEQRRLETERQKLVARQEQDRKTQAAQKEQSDNAQLAAAREANLKRMLGQAGNTTAGTGAATSTGAAARSSGPSAGYAGRIRARIKPNIVFNDAVNGSPLATVEVRLAPDGTIVGKRLVKSSGVKAWDDAVLRAVERTAVLPTDVDGRVPPPFEIDFRPFD